MAEGLNQSSLESTALELGLLDANAAQLLLRLRDDLQSLRHWVALVGAGVSRGAGLPSWDELAWTLASRFGVDLPTNQIAEVNYPDLLETCLESSETSVDFWNAVADQLCGGEPTALHTLILELPFEAFLTLNVDCLLDRAHEGIAGVDDPRTIAYPDNIRAADVSGRRLIHLHGRCNEDMSRDRLDDASTVLTRSGYFRADDVRRISRIIEGLIFDYQLFLIGMSLGDWQIRYLLRQVQTAERISRRSWVSRRRNPRERSSAMHWSNPMKRAPTGRGGSGLARPWEFEAIFYVNPDGRHESLVKILRWLSRSLASTTGRERYEVEGA